jgi:hypothetical protein
MKSFFVLYILRIGKRQNWITSYIWPVRQSIIHLNSGCKAGMEFINGSMPGARQENKYVIHPIGAMAGLDVFSECGTKG